MKNNILNLFAIALMFTAISCSTSATETPLADATSDDLAMEITSRSLESADSEDDLQILLVRKWQNESGEIFMDLKIDGSFEGKFNEDEIVTGTWDISEDQKTLQLKGDQSKEGKGTGFNATFSVLDMSIDNMKVQDQDGREISFTSPNE